MQEEKYGFVYIWFDRKHKRYYIGSHWGTEDDGYICSSVWMKQAYKRRPKDFKRRILIKINSSKKELLIEEQRWLDMIKLEEIKIRYYNLTRRAGNHWWIDKNNRITIGQKIGKARTGKKYSKRGPRTLEIKKKISKALKGRKISNETKTKRLGKTNRAKNYLLIDKEGNEYRIYNLYQFCKNNDEFNYMAMIKSILKNQKYKEWNIKCL